MSGEKKEWNLMRERERERESENLQEGEKKNVI